MMGARTTSDATVDRIIEMRERNVGAGIISRRLGVTYRVVAYHSSKHGVQPAAKHSNGHSRDYLRNGVLVRMFTPAEDAEMTRPSLAGIGVSDIARQTSRKRHSVQQRLYVLAAREDAQ